MTEGVKRRYVSSKREAQAKATRSAIVEAALQLFTANGYVATSIQSVADEAGVAVQTVYAGFGNKRELLRQVLEATVVGADAETLTESPAWSAIAEEPRPRRRVEMDAAFTAEISRRVGPVMKVLREASSVDPDFAATMAEITAQRRRDMKAAATLLAGSDGLKVPLEHAIATLYVLYNPETFTALTVDFGWSGKRYERWIAETLYRTLLA